MKITIVFLLAGLSLAQGSLPTIDFNCLKSLIDGQLEEFLEKLSTFVFCYEEYKEGSSTQENYYHAMYELTKILGRCGCLTADIIYGLTNKQLKLEALLESIGEGTTNIGDDLMKCLEQTLHVGGVLETAGKLTCSAAEALTLKDLHDALHISVPAIPI